MPENDIFKIEPSPNGEQEKNQENNKSKEFSKEFMIKIKEEIRVPQSSESTTWITIPNLITKQYPNNYAILEPVHKTLQPIMIGCQLVTVENRIPVRIMNIDQVDLTIPKFSKIGRLTILGKNPEIRSVKEHHNSLEKVTTAISRMAEVTEVQDEAEINKEIEKIYTENSWLKEVDISSKLSQFQKLQLLRLISKHPKAFSMDKYDLGLTDVLEFEIPTTTTEPISIPPYRLPYAKKQILQEILPGMVEAGIIEESTSNFNNPIVLVKKKNGEYRLCLDMRRLNDVTVSTNLPIPNIADCLDILRDKNYFSSLDMNSAYHQIPIKAEDRHKTAFTAVGKRYQYRTMLFGAKSAPFYWTHLMERVLGSMNFIKLLVYLDDILVFAKDFQVHLIRLEETFTRLTAANLKLKISKCSFGHSMTKFLGFVISRKGIIPNPNKVITIMQVTSPKNVTEVQRFLGLLNYYSRWIQNWQETAAPLTELTKKQVPFKWTEECEKSFNILKTQLANPPVMKSPDFTKEFIVSCDASISSAGAALIQKDEDGNDHVIAYFSKKFNSVEYRYGASDKELLSMMRAIEHFKVYLWGRKFTIRTDCKALTHFKNLKVTSARHGRWRTMLGEYNFDVVHIAGKEHVEADFLSRMPQNEWKIDVISNPRTVIYLSEVEVNPRLVQEWQVDVVKALKINTEKSPNATETNIRSDETDPTSLYKEMSRFVTGNKCHSKQFRRALNDYLYKHRMFYKENADGNIPASKNVEFLKHHNIPGAIELTAAASLVKIPIIVRSIYKNKIFLPLTETPVNRLPPLGSVVIMELSELGNYNWTNPDFNNNTKEDLLDSVLEGSESPGEDKDIEPWRVDQNAVLKREGFDDLPNRTKDKQCLEIQDLGEMMDEGEVDFLAKLKATSNRGERLFCRKAEDTLMGQINRLPDEERIVELQNKDPYCRAWKDYILKNENPYFGKHHLDKFSDNIQINPDKIIIFRKKSTRRNDQSQELVLLPLPMASLVLSLAHDQNGHFGTNKTTRILSERFWREKPSIANLTRAYIQGCLVCKSKVGVTDPKQAEIQENYIPPDRCTGWAIDHVKIGKSHNNNEYILSMADLYSRFVLIWPVPDTGVKSAIEAIMLNIVRVFGIPDVILSDRGSAFTSEIYNGIMNLLNISVRRTTALHPMTNGLIERFHRSLGDMLRTAALPDPKSWEELIPMITLAYNCSYNRNLQDTPGYTMFGRDLKLPIDLIIQRKIEHPYAIGENSAYGEAATLQARMQQLRAITQENIRKNLEENRNKENKKRVTREFKIGDKVLLKVPQKKGGRKKFHLKYKGIYRVEKVVNNVNLEIRSITGHGKMQLVHQNRVIHFNNRKRDEIIEWAEAPINDQSQDNDAEEGEEDWLEILE